MNSIKDIKMEVYELNRKIDIQSENPKTGKINAEIFEKYYTEKWKKLDALIKKYSDQNANLKKQIIQAKKKLEKKDKSIVKLIQAMNWNSLISINSKLRIRNM